MKRTAEIGRKLLNPGWKWLLPLTLLSAVLLFLVFSGKGQTPMAYGTYVLSFYTLCIGTAALVRDLRRLWRRLKAAPGPARYFEDAYFRVRTGLLLSFFINLCYAGLRIISAALYTSFWDGALGVYYVLLCVIRVYLIRSTTPPAQAAAEWSIQVRTRRRTGWLLLALDLSLIWIAFQIVQEGRGYTYPGTLIYAAAAYAFYTLILSVVQLVRYRQLQSPLLSAAKAINLTSAIVAVFSLETAMKYMFGGDEDFWRYMLPITAAAMCILVLLIALSMIRTPEKHGK